MLFSRTKRHDQHDSILGKESVKIVRLRITARLVPYKSAQRKRKSTAKAKSSFMALFRRCVIPVNGRNGFPER